MATGNKYTKHVCMCLYKCIYIYESTWKKSTFLYFVNIILW